MPLPDASVSWYSLMSVLPSRGSPRGRVPIRRAAADDLCSLFSPQVVFFFMCSPPDLEQSVGVCVWEARRGCEGLCWGYGVRRVRWVREEDRGWRRRNDEAGEQTPPGPSPQNEWKVRAAPATQVSTLPPGSPSPPPRRFIYYPSPSPPPSGVKYEDMIAFLDLFPSKASREGRLGLRVRGRAANEE